MNITTKILAAALFAGAFVSVGCASGRPPELYRDDTAKLLESANQGITDCYNTILHNTPPGTPAAQGSVTLHFVVHEDTGRLVHIRVDKARSTAPAPVQECVTKYIGDLHLEPADAQRGEAMFTWDFTPKEPAVVNQPDKPAS